MDYSRFVRLFQPFANFDSVFQHQLRRHRSFHQPVGQGFPFQKFHHQEVDPILMADVMKRADVGMVQRRDCPRFSLKPLLRLRAVGKMRRKNFDGHAAVKSRVARSIHLSHATRAKRRLDFIRTKSAA